MVLRQPHPTLFIPRYSSLRVYFKYINGKSYKNDYEMKLYQVYNEYDKSSLYPVLFFKMDGKWTNGKYYLIEPINPYDGRQLFEK